MAERVVKLREFVTSGGSYERAAANVRARRWQRRGRALVCHNGDLSARDREVAVLANAGARAVPTAFTAAEAFGLKGWERREVHVLVPSGSRVRAVAGIPMRVHYVRDWPSEQIHGTRGLHRVEHAVLVAAGTFETPRPACGIVAAAVQQRLTTAPRLLAALEQHPRQRHRRQVRLALLDIDQGAHALSEIDFVRLCRRHGLPPPRHQSVRRDPSDKRRYLDAEWRLPNGRVVLVEVDGAIHLEVQSWAADALRQNERMIAGEPVLRYPSVLLRTEEALVADQLRRALRL